MSALSDRQFLMVGAAVVIGGGLLFWFGRKAVGAAVDTAGGALSGNNALTQGTPYQGKGAAGTLGAATNAVLGGLPEKVGSGVAGWFGDLFDDYDPNSMDSKMGVR